MVVFFRFFRPSEDHAQPPQPHPPPALKCQVTDSVADLPAEVELPRGPDGDDVRRKPSTLMSPTPSTCALFACHAVPPSPGLYV